MNRLILIYCFLLIVYSCNTKHKKKLPNGKYKSYYESGEIKEKGVYRKGKKIDTIIKYFKDGNVKKLEIIKNGDSLKNIYYHLNGKVKSTGYSFYNKKIDWWFYYDKNGMLSKKEQYLLIDTLNILNQKIKVTNGNIEYSKSCFHVINNGKLKYYSPYDSKDLKLGETRFIVLKIFTEYDSLKNEIYFKNNSQIENGYYIGSSKAIIEENVFIHTDSIVDNEKAVKYIQVNQYVNW
ncbi:toxin-antitoxin system YwqK family antitoxin [Flavobacteriaceae bacterium 14752]|uniref:toxin-antitoxin system YwqK family antitoxin n=1 Tax=Mesohalobacter salilacus TaxID=2491711 RepID=UPI000F630F70|nr:hypothetical protein EIG84_07280 [Flavobacteriaceae bacterium 14752]